MLRSSSHPPTAFPVVYYRKAPGFPVYYQIDHAQNLIESVKDWQDQAKGIDQYEYFEEFAQNICEGFEPIPAALYRTVRAYVLAVMEQPYCASDASEAPTSAQATSSRSLAN